MQLHESVLLGVQVGKELNDDSWKKLVENAFAALLGKPEIYGAATIHSSKSDVVKEAYAGLLALLAEAAKQDAASGGRENGLDSLEDILPPARRDALRAAYRRQRERLLLRLAQHGRHPPHITDCNWSIDHIVKFSELDEAAGPVYRIRLTTDTSDDKDGGRSTKHIEFSCNTQQLQDLVYKLKDAVRHCERISSTQ